MGTTSFVDMLLYLVKRIKLIVVFVVIGVVVAFVLANVTQEYTATVAIQYSYPGAEDGVDPLGGTLDVYEVMNPSLIAKALKEMGSDLSTEEVRNKLSVSPVVSSKETEAQQAKIALGDVVEVKTTVYNVSYTCSGELGGAFAQRFLYYLLQAYDEFFSQKYLEMERIADFMGVVNVAGMDYMEKCDYISSQLNSTIATLDRLVNSDPDFTAKATGLDFAALRSFYSNMRYNQYNRLYANVRIGLLSNNKDLLIQGYKKRIEDMKLSAQNFKDESDQSHEIMLQFYEVYKANNLYYQSRTSETYNGIENNDNKNVVYDYDLTLMINTYDDILLRYVTTGVNATTTGHDMDYYQNLINEFTGDTETTEDKKAMLDAADVLISEVVSLSKKYAELANKTLNDYYGSMIAQNLKYMMAVEVSPTVSTSTYVMVGFFIMMLLGAATAIVLEIVLNQLNRRKFELLQANDDGTLTPEIIDNMTPVEHAFYEQAVNGFTEFYLMYQPMVHEGRWEISETLVRWESKRRGQILPDEFIPIAEKYKLMGKLGEWILAEACRQSIAWAAEGKISPCVSVNYSTQQIESQLFIDTICRTITETKVDPRNIYLEISGGGELNNVEAVAPKFVALKALGLRLAIDRFGESVSSLRTLYDLPADMVKLDRRFLSALRDPGEKNAALLNQVITVCKELHLKICVNGIEEPWQVEVLEAMGAEYLQGFYFSSPLPVDAYEKRYNLYMQRNGNGNGNGNHAAADEAAVAEEATAEAYSAAETANEALSVEQADQHDVTTEG